MSHRSACRQSDGGSFSTEASSSQTTLCQTDKNLTCAAAVCWDNSFIPSTKLLTASLSEFSHNAWSTVVPEWSFFILMSSAMQFNTYLLSTYEEEPGRPCKEFVILVTACAIGACISFSLRLVSYVSHQFLIDTVCGSLGLAGLWGCRALLSLYKAQVWGRISRCSWVKFQLMTNGRWGVNTSTSWSFK